MGCERDCNASFFQQKLDTWHQQRADSSRTFTCFYTLATSLLASMPTGRRARFWDTQPPAAALNASWGISAAFLSWCRLPHLQSSQWRGVAPAEEQPWRQDRAPSQQGACIGESGRGSPLVLTQRHPTVWQFRRCLPVSCTRQLAVPALVPGCFTPPQQPLPLLQLQIEGNRRVHPSKPQLSPSIATGIVLTHQTDLPITAPSLWRA